MLNPKLLNVPAVGKWGPVRALGQRWAEHLKSGRWEFRADGFWTTPYPFWWMPKVRQGACLLLGFKGLGRVKGLASFEVAEEQF